MNKETKNILTYLVSQEKIEDKHVQELIDNNNIDISDYPDWKIDDEALNNVLDKKGLSSNKLKGNYDLAKKLIKIFDRNHCVNILQQIIKNGGLCESDKFINNDNDIKNIYTLITNDENVINAFSKIASIELNNVNDNKIGRFEVLMKLLFIDTIPNFKGDISCKNDINIEVKCSAARIKGQSEHLLSPTIIYNTLFNLIAGIEYNNGFFGQINNKEISYRNYFQKYSTIIFLEKLLDDYDPDGSLLNNENNENNIFYILVKSVCSQYDDFFVDNKNNDLLNHLVKEIKNINTDYNYITYDNKYNIDDHKIFNIVGYIQLNTYMLYENFNYICVFNKNNGNYDCLDKNEIMSCKTVLSSYYFTPIGTGAGRAVVCGINLLDNK